MIDCLWHLTVTLCETKHFQCQTFLLGVGGLVGVGVTLRQLIGNGAYQAVDRRCLGQGISA